MVVIDKRGEFYYCIEEHLYAYKGIYIGNESFSWTRSKTWIQQQYIVHS